MFVRVAQAESGGRSVREVNQFRTLKTRFKETTTLSYNNSLEYNTRKSRSISRNFRIFFQKYIDIDVDLMDTILRCNFNYQVGGQK